MFRHYKGRAKSLLLHRYKRRCVKRLVARDGNACSYCGCAFTPAGKRQRTLDHRVPRAHGGRDRYRNFVLACLACNGKKRTLPEDDFRAGEWLARRKAELLREAARAA